MIIDFNPFEIAMKILYLDKPTQATASLVAQKLARKRNAP